MTDVESDEAERVMDLARAFHHRARGHEETARRADDEHVQTVNQAHSTAYARAADVTRHAALYLDGQLDAVPPELVSGRAMKNGTIEGDADE